MGGGVSKPEDKKVNYISHISGDKDSLEHLANGNQFIGKRPVLKNSTIHFNGRNNILYCEDNVKLVNSNLSFQGDNSVIYLSSNRHEYKLNTVIYRNSVFFVGENTYFNGVLNASLSERRHILIGAGGLFSFDIWIRNADPHLVYGCETMRRTNPTQSVFIGQHVWVGQAAMILKGTQVGAGSIIGAMSLVAGKKIPPNTSWGGNPARLLKENLFWEGSCVHAWTQEMTEKSLSYADDKFIFTGKERSISYDEIDEGLSSAKNAKERLDYLLEVKAKI